MPKTIFCRLCALLLFVAVFLGLLLASFPITSYAASEAVYIDQTTIKEDFEGFGINTALYPANSSAERQLVYFIESCYSEKFSGQDQHYGLYLWIYNPKCTPITENGNNKVNFSIDGKEYNNIPLEHLSHTADHLFYKFRVASSEAAALLSAAREYAKAHEGERVYSIAGVQLQEGSNLAHDSGVSKTFTFVGYAHGCDESAEEASTLAMKTEGLETIHLTLEHTTWRSDGLRDNWYRDAIHTAYFALPKAYLDDYGKLQKIKAEWDEYKTKEIFVTSASNAIHELTPYIGKTLPNGLDENLTFRVLWEMEEVVLIDPINGYDDVSYWFHKGYNDLKDDEVGLKGDYHYAADYSTLSRFDWLFHIGENDIENQKPISSATVENYMKDYTSTYGGELVGGQYSKDLFLDSIDADRAAKYDYNGHHLVQEIDADIDIDDFYVDSGFWDHIFGDGVSLQEGLKPIEVINDAAAIAELMAWSPSNTKHIEAFEEKYFVENDGGSSGNVLQDLQNIAANGDAIVLFRFAVTDYYSSLARFDNTDAWYGLDGSKNLASVNGYVAQETVFLNFDVISLSFKTAEGGNALTVIPVVADPINVIPSLIPPAVNEELDWLKLIVMLLLLLFLYMILAPFISPFITIFYQIIGLGVKVLVRFAFGVLCLPFKILGWIFLRRR